MTAVAVPTSAEALERRITVSREPVQARFADYFALTKPRIIVLLEVTALAAMVMAARGWPSTLTVLLTLVGGALAAGGANTINMWFDRDIDKTMTRTCARPIPSGRITPARALTFGVAQGAAAFALLGTTVNLLSATLAISALLFYVCIYTMWLKRSSAQNIVIGGAAGAVPPLVGWAAVTGHLDITALYLFAVIFFWTPPHFWALAMLMRSDYHRAHVPMLPVVEGMARTRTAILQYTVILVVVTILPVLAHSFGWTYIAGAAVLDALFVAGAVRLARERSSAAAVWLFHYSLLYLALLFATMAADRVIGVTT